MRPLSPVSDTFPPVSYSVRPSPPVPSTSSSPPPPRRDSFATSDEALYVAAVNRLLTEVMTLTEAARRLRVLAAAAEVTGTDAAIATVLRALDTAAVELEMLGRAGVPRRGG